MKTYYSYKIKRKLGVSIMTVTVGRKKRLEEYVRVFTKNDNYNLLQQSKMKNLLLCCLKKIIQN